MDAKKIIYTLIFIALAAISILLAFWFYNRFMSGSSASAPSAPSSNTPPAPTNLPLPTPDAGADPNIGKEAYAGTSGTLYDLQGNKVKDFQSGDDLGKITDVKGQTFILDGKNKVDISVVLTR